MDSGNKEIGGIEESNWWPELFTMAVVTGGICWEEWICSRVDIDKRLYQNGPIDCRYQVLPTEERSCCLYEIEVGCVGLWSNNHGPGRLMTRFRLRTSCLTVLGRILDSVSIRVASWIRGISDFAKDSLQLMERVPSDDSFIIDFGGGVFNKGIYRLISSEPILGCGGPAGLELRDMASSLVVTFHTSNDVGISPPSSSGEFSMKDTRLAIEFLILVGFVSCWSLVGDSISSFGVRSQKGRVVLSIRLSGVQLKNRASRGAKLLVPNSNSGARQPKWTFWPPGKMPWPPEFSGSGLHQIFLVP
ncbi:hypothetical protein Tco_0428227 [Tanacetum coccineum]